jgi:hypothetical protein
MLPRFTGGQPEQGEFAMAVRRQLHLGAFMRPVSIHTGA